MTVHMRAHQKTHPHPQTRARTRTHAHPALHAQAQRYEDELEAQALSLEAMSEERETARANMQVWTALCQAAGESQKEGAVEERETGRSDGNMRLQHAP